MSARNDATFARCAAEGRPALITYIMAGDPTLEDSAKLLNALPEAGADIIELGMPFSDPTADGPTIQAAAARALKHRVTIDAILEVAADFRNAHPETPLILMGYINPVLSYGTDRFAAAASEAGVDGVILVDVPPEEDEIIAPALQDYGVDLVRLIAPTTDDSRIQMITKSASGFVYAVAIKGITGTASADDAELKQRISHIKSLTPHPVAAGFGIRTPEQVAALKGVADGVVVGSALVEAFTAENNVEQATQFVRSLRAALD